MVVYKHNNIDVYKQQKLSVCKCLIFCVNKCQKKINKNNLFTPISFVYNQKIPMENVLIKW